MIACLAKPISTEFAAELRNMDIRLEGMSNPKLKEVIKNYLISVTRPRPLPLNSHGFLVLARTLTSPNPDAPFWSCCPCRCPLRGATPPPLTRTAFNAISLSHLSLTLSQHHYGSPHLSADPRLSDRRLGVANQRPGVWDHLARSISPFLLVLLTARLRRVVRHSVPVFLFCSPDTLLFHAIPVNTQWRTILNTTTHAFLESLISDPGTRGSATLRLSL